MKIELSANIKRFLEECSIEAGPSGLSGAGIYRLRRENNTFFLKVVDINNRFIDELESECNILKWLEGKLPAPRIINFEKAKDRHYLLMTAVEGDTLEQLYKSNTSVEEIIKIYAESLKHIHSIDLKGCTNDASDETMLDRIRNYIELGIDLEDMEDEYKGLSPLQLYDKLLSMKPKSNDYVFVHGDYCLDNIIIKGNKLNGIIDVGRGGTGDRYKDIALAVRKISRDFGEQWLSLFFEIYGIRNPDWDKIEFYIIADEFY